MKYSGKTDIGLKRKNNQDCYKVISKENYLCAVVCDGMGGAKGGNVASSLAVRAFIKHIKTETPSNTSNSISVKEGKRIIKGAVDKANAAVYETANTDINLEGMGTTLVSVFISGNNIIVVNIGDSRLYTYKDNTLKQITNDHSFVQFLIDKGSIKPEEAKNHPNRNIILRALGVNEKVEPDIFVFKEEFDMLLLCSDGLTALLGDDEITEVLKSDAKRKITLKARVDTLIEKANIKGGVDNITAVLISNE